MTRDYNFEIDSRTKEDLINTFESVKEAVRKTKGSSRAGLMLGLQEMGASLNGFIGAYYPINSNLIVMNKTPIRRIKETNPGLLQPYSFHVLLHEYIHSLGVFDEHATAKRTYEICSQYLGEEHLATEFSKNMGKFLPNLVYPYYGWQPETEGMIELVKGFDRSSTSPYIA